MKTERDPTGQDPGPDSLSKLIADVIDRRGYSSLSEMARHTDIPYPTLWAWEKGTRNQKRPPTVQVLRMFATDFGVPESVVFRAAGRAYSDPGALDSESLTLLELFKSLPSGDQARLVRVVDLFRQMTPDQRAIAESVLRGIAHAKQS